MTQPVDWNPRPQQISINLTRGGKFLREGEFRTRGEDLWVPPAGTTLVLSFGPADDPIETWSATIDGSKFVFARTVAQILTASSTIREGTAVRLLTTFPPETEPDVRAVGRVFWT